MKKILSGVLAGLLTMSMGVSALAAGVVIAPIANETNSITVGKSSDEKIMLTFEADSDPEKFYFGASTSWDNRFAHLFADQDAFFYSIAINPRISASQVPILAIYNPFVDEDGTPYISTSKVVIYEIVDDGLVDVTDEFTAGTDEDGESVFIIRTRTPGSYIFTNQAVDISGYEPETSSSSSSNRKVIHVDTIEGSSSQKVTASDSAETSTSKNETSSSTSSLRQRKDFKSSL